MEFLNGNDLRNNTLSIDVNPTYTLYVFPCNGRFIEEKFLEIYVHSRTHSGSCAYRSLGVPLRVA
jgi:hypothetical protein